MTLDLTAMSDDASLTLSPRLLLSRSDWREQARSQARDVLALAEEVRELHEATRQCLATSRPGRHGLDTVDVSFPNDAWDTLRDSTFAPVRHATEEEK